MWLEYESSVQALKSWMATQEERLKRKHRIEDLTSVQNALRDCQVGSSHCVNADISKLVFPYMLYLLRPRCLFCMKIFNELF